MTLPVDAAQDAAQDMGAGHYKERWRGRYGVDAGQEWTLHMTLGRTPDIE